MSDLRYRIERGRIMATSSAVPILGDEDPTEALVEDVLQVIGTDLYVTVGDVTMFLAAWRDPEHWAEDWARQLAVDYDDVPEAIAELLAKATT